MLYASALTTLLAAGSAMAINSYPLVGNVVKPSHCGNSGTLPYGTWLTNKACGYVMGTGIPGHNFDVSTTDSNNFHFGRYRGSGGNFCTFILPGALDTSSGSPVDDSCSSATASGLCNRQSFGKDFDSAPHEGDGGIVVPLDISGCSHYLNYFVDSAYQSGSFQDAISGFDGTGAGYRYTTRDGQAAMIRGQLNGETVWHFVPRSCIESQLSGHTLHNEGSDSC